MCTSNSRRRRIETITVCTHVADRVKFCFRLENTIEAIHAHCSLQFVRQRLVTYVRTQVVPHGFHCPDTFLTSRAAVVELAQIIITLGVDRVRA